VLFLMLLFRLFLTLFALMQPITTESACVRLNLVRICLDEPQ